MTQKYSNYFFSSSLKFRSLDRPMLQRKALEYLEAALVAGLKGDARRARRLRLRAQDCMLAIAEQKGRSVGICPVCKGPT